MGPAVPRSLRRRDRSSGLPIQEVPGKPRKPLGAEVNPLLQIQQKRHAAGVEHRPTSDRRPYFAFLVPSPTTDPIPEEIEKRNFYTFKMALDQVAACMEDGVLEKDDPLETAITVWAELHGLVTLYRTGRFGEDPEQFRATYRHSVRRVLRGLMTEEALRQSQETAKR